MTDNTLSTKQLIEIKKILANEKDVENINKIYNFIKKVVKLGESDDEVIQIECYAEEYNLNDGLKVLDTILRTVKRDDEVGIQKLSEEFFEECKGSNTLFSKNTMKNLKKIDYSIVDEDGNTGFMILIKNNSTSKIKQITEIDTIIDFGFNVVNHEGLTPLYLALSKNNIDAIDCMFYFKDEEILLDRILPNGDNILFKACSKFIENTRNKKICEKIFDRVFSSDKCDLIINHINNTSNMTIMHCLIKNDKEELALKVLEKGFKQFKVCENINKVTVFNFACCKNMKKLAFTMIDKYPHLIDFKTCDRNNTSPLIWCCHHEMFDTAQKIIDLDIEQINTIDDENNTPLLYAVQAENEEFALKLLDFDRNINVQNQDKTNSLMYALHANMINFVNKISERDDLSYDAVNEDGLTALYIASMYSTEDICLKILNKSPKQASVFSKNNYTPLMGACRNGYENYALKLLNLGVSNPHLIDNSGDQALLYACENNMEDVAIKILEDKRIEFWKKDSKKKKVYDYIFSQNLENVVIKIIEIIDIKYLIKDMNELKKYINKSNTKFRTKYLNLIAKRLSNNHMMNFSIDILRKTIDYF